MEYGAIDNQRITRLLPKNRILILLIISQLAEFGNLLKTQTN